MSWFYKDRHSSTGYTHSCRVCRSKNNKVVMELPEWEVIPTTNLPRSMDKAKVIPGSWERLVQHARLLKPDEALRVPCVKSFNRHWATAMGIRGAAKKLGVQVWVTHGDDGVYVKLLTSGKQKAIL